MNKLLFDGEDRVDVNLTDTVSVFNPTTDFLFASVRGTNGKYAFKKIPLPELEGATIPNSDFLEEGEVNLFLTPAERSAIANLGNTVLSGYRHTQATPNSVWTIVHNLGRNPIAITLQDTEGNSIVGFNYQFDNPNQMTITHGYAFAGTGDFL